jgi:hypothetical protein
MWSSARDETESAVVAADAAPLEPVDTLLDHVVRDMPEPDAGGAKPDDHGNDDGNDHGNDDDDEVWP